MGESDTKTEQPHTGAPFSSFPTKNQATSAAASEPVASTQLQEAIADFAEHLHLVVGRSPATVAGYRSDLIDFCQHAHTFEDFTLVNLRAWLGAAVDAGKSRATIARRAAAARSFSSWCEHQGYLDTNVAARLAVPKSGRSLPTVVTPTAAETLMVSSQATTEPEYLRDTAMLELLYATGIRVSELCGIDLADVNYSRNTVKVTGKGNKQRVVPLGTLPLPRSRRGATMVAPTCLIRKNRLTTPCFSGPGVGGLILGWCAPWWRGPANNSALTVWARTPCGTARQHTCSMVAPTCGSCRNSSAIPRCKLPRSIPT